MKLEVHVGVLGDKARHHKAQRRDQHHHQRDGPVQRQHEDQSAQNGEHSGEQLGEAHEQSVGKLIHIGHHPAEQVAGGVGVQRSNRQGLELVHGGIPQIPGDTEHHPVIAHAQNPLAQRGDADGEQNVAADDRHSGEVDRALTDHLVDGIAGQNGNIELGRHAEGGGEQTECQIDPVGTDIVQDPLQSGGLSLFLPGHPSSPPRLNWLS